MRLRALGLLGLLLLASAAQPASAISWHFLGQRVSTTPGWWTETFSVANTDDILVSFGVDSHGEVVGTLVALFDGGGQILGFYNGAGQRVADAMVAYAWVGGSMIDARAGTPTTGAISNDGLPGPSYSTSFEDYAQFHCDATCNPSRTFKLVVVSGGELDAWGYGLFVGGNGTLLSNTSGHDAWVRSSRAFDGTGAHATVATRSGPPTAGVSVMDDGVFGAHVDDRFVGAFFKPTGTPPETMTLARPGGTTTACACIVQGGAGEYAFHYSDRDVGGREAIAIAADVTLG